MRDHFSWVNAKVVLLNHNGSSTPADEKFTKSYFVK